MKRLLLAAAAVLALAGCGSSQAAAHKPATITVVGQFTVDDSCSAMADDGAADIVAGQQVTVTGPTGKQLAAGPLEDGTPGTEATPTCVFTFTIHGVPSRFAEYGFRVGHRGTVDYSRAELNSPVDMELSMS